ncbi:MAG: hypothetical protein Q9217_002830 [Psora testacea]
MSTQGTGEAAPGDRPKAMAKFKRRMSRILGRDESKRGSVAGASTTAPVAGTSSTAPAVAKTEKTPAAATAPTLVAAPQTAAGGKIAPTPIRPKSAMTAAENSKIQEEKIRVMFAKYNITLEAGEWTPPFKAETLRVEKKLRRDHAGSVISARPLLGEGLRNVKIASMCAARNAHVIRRSQALLSVAAIMIPGPGFSRNGPATSARMSTVTPKIPASDAATANAAIVLETHQKKTHQLRAKE